ncbi:biliverdin-producing heme oxygenase [Acinetobacter sp. EC24]|nr:biliverdin-producing heme oxygenase [Acinetobacter rathckeae]MBF7696543.1 biliverdin-producing heme oxygenase [Acinetobacter rathckeae]
MYQLMHAANVFSTKEKYTQFTLSQYYFQKQIEHLFLNPKVMAIIPDLDTRGRSDLALLDLKYLGVTPQTPYSLKEIDYPQALGWIYVSEGSTLGAAFLFKEAQKMLGFNENLGARNLAAYPEGRMKVWKRFTQALNDASFSIEQQNLVIQGALEGFEYFGELLQCIGSLE